MALESPQARQFARLAPPVRVVRVSTGGLGLWNVVLAGGGGERLRVRVEDRRRRALPPGNFSWVDTEGWRYTASVRKMEIILAALSLLLAAAFADFRRPLRLSNLDLVALLGFWLSFALLNRSQVLLSVPLFYPPLIYLFVRMLWIGVRGPPRHRLTPKLPHGWLLAGLVVLVLFRVGFNVADSDVTDVGYAGVFGAESIREGYDLYQHDFNNLDTYGPVTYLAYAPFEAIFPLKPRGEPLALAAAHGAAIAFDLLSILLLFLLGRRLRPGPEGKRLGLALAFAWSAYPFSFYVLANNTNDALVALLFAAALLAVASPPLRGAAIALGIASKFVAATVAPLFARGTDESWYPGQVWRYLGALAAVLAITVVAYLPDGGLREMYDTTLGFQRMRSSFYSLWGQYPELDWLRAGLQACLAVLALALAFRPRRRTLEQLSALAAALVIGAELTLIHAWTLYLVWFLPLALVALVDVPGAGAASRYSEHAAELSPPLKEMPGVPTNAALQ